MSSKVFVGLCTQALLIQFVLSQCTSRAAIEASGFPGPYGRVGANLATPAYAYNSIAAPLAYDGLNWAGRAYDGMYPSMEYSPTSGGGLPVTSMSPISPTGISVVSDNAYEGPLTVVGELPFLGAVSMEGMLPTAGAGAISHGCVNGVTAMITEGIASTVAPATDAFGPGLGSGFGAMGYGGANFAPAVGPGAYGYGGCNRGLLY
ncbi:unnamed protein product [Arctia plantaginis]|uniref:Uncharacterized protein n=1 Tax=Arctia plantaginis TaxID=874455 RepID=A0A8S1A662_ARCPL|nr:unnamed protein product [Arctia plantaginis]